jgi:mono/diheme cytochrome c family protein
MKLFTRIFCWLLGIGAGLHFLFGLVAWFSPDQLALIIGLERMEFSYVWLGNIGMLIVPLTLFALPVMCDPVRYRVYGWLITLGRLLQGIYWCYVAQNQVNAVFKPFSTLWLAIGGAQAIILLFLAEAEVRISITNIKATLAQWKESRANLNKYLKWFGWVAYAGMAFNVVWVFQSIFKPSMLAFPIGTQPLFQSNIWLGIAGVVLFTVTILYLPSAAATTQYFTYDWLIVVSRIIAAVFWFTVWRQPYHGGFLLYMFSDGTFGVVLFFLLQKGAPDDKKLSSANLQSFLSSLSDKISMQGSSKFARGLAAVLVIIGIVIGGISWYYFIRAVPDLQYGDDADHYKYASVGLAGAARVPYYLFDVLPDLFPELMPDPKKGYAGFGLLFEKGHATPVGFAYREIGYPAVEPNCAMCHTGSVRLSANSDPVVVPGAPAHELDLEGFQWFLYNCATSPKFNTGKVMTAIEKKHPLGALDDFMYRNVIIPAAQTALIEQRADYLWQLHNRPWQGRGRTDTFNTTKLAVLKFPDDGTIGTTDLPQTWNQAVRRDMWLHWDANNNKIEQRNYAAAMAVGATPFSVIPDAFQRTTDFLWYLRPPKFPMPIDAAKAAQGKVVFEQNCATCHSFSKRVPSTTEGQHGKGVGEPCDDPNLGTDRHRWASFTQGLVDAFHQIAEAPFYFPAYTKWDNYANVPLDGIWARGPYLHHGAVPSLWDLLQTPDKRPKQFYRGYNLLDPVNVGFVSQGPDAQKEGWLYNTAEAGNDNSGHLYGTQLSDADKWAVIEFLKTDDPELTGRTPGDDSKLPKPPQAAAAGKPY